MTNTRAKALEALTEWKISRSTGNADLEHEKAKAMSKAVEEALSEPKWKSMDSAPRDGTPFIAWWPDQYHYPVVVFWADKYAPFIGWKVMGWTHEKFVTEPTHWMPLPDAPTGEKS